MKKLNNIELSNVNGGGPLMDWYNDIKDFVNNHVGDLWRGMKDGWNSVK